MAAIDIGAGASDRTSSKVIGYTYIDSSNPANGDGTLTSFEVWMIDGSNPGPDTFYWGTFYGSGTSWTSRGQSSNLGHIAGGSKQTFTGQNVTVATNDIIGCYWADSLETPSLEYGVGTGTYGYVSGNKFGVGATTYTTSANKALSLYATGATVEAGHPTMKRWGGVPFMRLNKGIWCL